MSLIQATITLLLTGMFCSAFPQCCWPWSTLTSSHECCYFTEINRRVVCIWMQLVETTINRLMQAPSSSNNQQVSQWKCNPPKHQMLSQAPQQQHKTSTKSRARGMFSIHTSDNKRPKQVTSTQAPKWQWYRKISLPRTNTRHNEHHNSNHDIYEIKNKTFFTTHKRPQQTTSTMVPEDLIVLQRTNARHYHMYDFIKIHCQYNTTPLRCSFDGDLIRNRTGSLANMT